jgi:hypothetical protein
MRPVLLILVLGFAGCAAFPARPDVAFYVHPDPLVIPQAPTARANMPRAITPAPIPAPICLTEADHLALSGYFDQVDAWTGWKR